VVDDSTRVQAAVAAATELHGQGYNCAEAVLGGVLAYVPSRPLALRIATGFGGGIGRTGGICGAVSGAVMAISWVAGRDRPDDRESYVRCAEMIRALMDRFRETHSTTVCRELTGYDLSDPSVLDRFAADETRRRNCAEYISTASRIAAAMLLESPQPAERTGGGEETGAR